MTPEYNSLATVAPCMATKPTKPITLLWIEGDRGGDGQRVDLVPEKGAYTIRLVEDGDDEEHDADDLPPSLTAAEWGRVAINLIIKCPSAGDPLGLVSATASDLNVTGRTVGRRGKWTASLTDVGSDFNGRTLLEWEASRPLDEWEIGAAFKAMIERLSHLSNAEDHL